MTGPLHITDLGPRCEVADDILLNVQDRVVGGLLTLGGVYKVRAADEGGVQLGRSRSTGQPRIRDKRGRQVQAMRVQSFGSSHA
jgi:hypothetical protein